MTRLSNRPEDFHGGRPRGIYQTVAILQQSVAGEPHFHSNRVEHRDLASGDRQPLDLLIQARAQIRSRALAIQQGTPLQQFQIKQDARLQSRLLIIQ